MDTKNYERRDVKWVEGFLISFHSKFVLCWCFAQGLRGITAATIVTAHIYRSIYDDLGSPKNSQYSFPSLFQLPFFRLVISGRASLSFFFLLTGFVNSLSFLKQTRAGNPDAALAGLAKSSFRRIGRMVLPATAATIVSWALCQMGLFQAARKGEINWFRDISPSPSLSFSQAIWDLMYNIYNTWGSSKNDFDKVQWNLSFLLKGSFIVYTILLMTTYVTPNSRKMVLFSYYVFSWMNGDGKHRYERLDLFRDADDIQVLIGMNISAGMFIAELFYDQSDSKPFLGNSKLSKAVPIAVLVVGIIVAGYPESHPEWCSWSDSLRIIGINIFRPGAELSRNWGSIGASLILVGILFWPSAKKFLAHPLLVWTGKVSFAVFLIHSFLIRSLFCSMLYICSSPPNDVDSGKITNAQSLQRARGLNLIIISLMFFPFLYLMAQLWSTHVESRCDQISQLIEDWMTGQAIQAGNVGLPL